MLVRRSTMYPRVVLVFASMLVSGLVTITGCSDSGYLPSETSNAIYSELEANNFESINLSTFGDQRWSKVCFLGPYNELSKKALGFDWNISEHSDVLKSDGHNVIVFATESEVIEYVIHSRTRGDFWQLSGDCVHRNEALFIRHPDGKYGRSFVLEKLGTGT